MEIEDTLLACGFDEADAKLIVGGFLTGISVFMETAGYTTQTVGEVLTEEQVREILALALDDRLSQLPPHRLALIDLGALEALGY
jgi:hypothetical protein